MAAPTDPRVEANSLSTTTLYWAYGGSAGVAIYRSTDGISYAEVAVVAASALTYNDTGLAAGTKYWYKLSDDDGSTFSSVVTVWTHGCVDVATGGDGFSLPRFAEVPSAVGGAEGVEVVLNQMVEQKAKLDDMAQRIEDTLQGRLLDPAECAVCPEDGAITVNCSDGCRDFVVIADEDINSIAIQMCDEGEGNIEFIIPPNTTRQICGWPSGFGFGGDECFRAPIVTGAAGRSMSVPFARSGRAGGGKAGPPKSRPGYGKGTGRGGGGGATCTCVPGKQGQLTIKACNANNSLKCSTDKRLDLRACGGKPPYTWSNTGTVVTFSSTASNGEFANVQPPANAGSGVSGKAYSKAIFGVGCGHSLGTTHAAGQTKASYNCDDSLNTCPDGAVGGTATVLAFLDSSCSCSVHNGHAVSGAGAITEVSCSNRYATSAECTAAQAIGSITDHRTAGMISDGCTPCGLAANGATVTVTDAVGTQTTIILKA